MVMSIMLAGWEMGRGELFEVVEERRGLIGRSALFAAPECDAQ